ncbi:ABC transporter permease [Thermasporomyces composti]|jgi:peptide/nickel transport system permease protein|uniref:Peptide/nickel transport system permease protein n=1 Tax=Thermasporomyces composti TaxID=696763 RepID=A0A3D9V804_THECX|nr:ABC transporter permease [Thermasporomyces composti]REF37599.1 peptide/nickel transport system permease protein [Thermasporomyces composti]
MRYFASRLGFFLLTLWAAVTLNFIIPRLQPGDPAQSMVQRLAGQTEAVDPAAIESVRVLLGLPTGSILEQYVDYLKAVVRGDFGISYTYFPYSVTHIIGEALPWTIVLVGVTHVLGFVIGTLLGAWAAWKRNTKFDAVVSLGSTFLGTLPFFWIALILIYVFAFTLRWFPEAGGYSGEIEPSWSWAFIADAVYHGFLPALSLLITGPIGWIMSMRNNMVHTLGEDYTRLAQAKGLRTSRVALVYSARVAILPNVTGFAMGLGTIVGGTLMVEMIFGYPGMGKLMYEAISSRDYPLMQTIFLFTTVGVLLANLCADILYGILDPRVRREAQA